jgi:hypothetical protein
MLTSKSQHEWVTCMMEIRLEPRRVALCLLWVFVGLLASFGYVAVWRIQSGGQDGWIAPLFDFDREGNFPSWYNSILFVLAAWISWINSKYASRHDRRQSLYWAIVAAVLLILSVDELVALHELLPSVRSSEGLVNFGWVTILGPVAAVFGLSFVPFLLRLPRRVAFCLIASGAVYVTGAVVLEVIGGQIAEKIVLVPRSEMLPDHWLTIARNRFYLLEVALEESFEQCGLILYIYGAMTYLSQAGAVLSASFAGRSS